MSTKNLFELVRARFPDRQINVGGERAACVVFPAAHAEVGDIEIYDNHGELVVVIGKFTHTHFANYDRGISQAERDRRITEEVLQFLEEVFADRIEFFGNGRGSGAWRVRKNAPRGAISKLLFGRTTYVWSGPLQMDG